MELLTGYGPPLKTVIGNPGQCYKDLNTNDIYKCVTKQSVSRTAVRDKGQYECKWKLEIKDSERPDLKETDETKPGFVKNARNGGGGATPDWNQNDETAPDYIKNRPFFEKKERKEVYPITELEFSDVGGGLYMSDPDCTTALRPGNMVTVTFDGVAYDCAVSVIQGALFYGNTALIGPYYEDNGMPFGIIDHGDYIQIGTSDASSTHKVGISLLTSEITKIDNKFIDGTFPMVVNLGVEYLNSDGTEMRFSMDKTFREIKNAVKAGRFVYLLDATDENGYFYKIIPLQSIEVDIIRFYIYNYIGLGSDEVGSGGGYTIDQSNNVERIGSI